MSDLVTVVISAGGAQERLLNMCLSSLSMYLNVTPYRVLMIAPTSQSEIPDRISRQRGVDFQDFDVQISAEDISGSRIHSALLDKTINQIETPYVLTLDADCFPVAHGWLDDLMELNADVSGILHPFKPTGEDLPDGIEKRIRTQLNWNHTHVACQLVYMDVFDWLGVGYSDGDDTGLAIPVEARKRGLRVEGFLPTRCGRGEVADYEANREHCVVFGDRVYHHGGGSRESQEKAFCKPYMAIRERVLFEGAEFILRQGHKYEFNDEDAIVDRMVQGLMNGYVGYISTQGGF